MGSNPCEHPVTLKPMTFLTGAEINTLDDVITRLAKIEAAMELLVQQRIVKEAYTTAEVAKILARPSSPSANGAGCGVFTRRSGNAGVGNPRNG